MEQVEKLITTHPDFPKPGIAFKNILPIMRHPEEFKILMEEMEIKIKSKFPNATKLVGLEARGFLFGPWLSLKLNIPFVVIRKKGKLPGEVCSVSYQKEYGEDVFEIEKNAITKGDKVVLVDDLLATGGTLAASIKLVEETGGNCLGSLVVVELEYLDGAKKLPNNFVSESLIKY